MELIENHSVYFPYYLFARIYLSVAYNTIDVRMDLLVYIKTSLPSILSKSTEPWAIDGHKKKINK